MPKLSRLSLALLSLLFAASVQNSKSQAADVDLLQVDQAVLDAQEQRIAAMVKATASTVGVFSGKGEGGGSGVIISTDGYVLTNFHVSSPFGHQMRCGLSDGRMFDAVIVGFDPTGDLALLRMFGHDDLPAADIADSDTVNAGDWCFAAGNPFVLATNLEPTVTWGVVSGVRRYQYPSASILEYTDCIQTDAAINPGNSGGPLYNSKGQLIGINGRCSFEKRGRVNVGVGYAISINQAMLFLRHLKSGRVVDHATAGFTVASDSERRVLVSNILDSSDAYRRGLRYDDEILALGNRDVRTVNELKNVLGIYPATYRVPLRFKREGRTIETWIRLDALHSADELLAIVAGESEMPKEKPDGKKQPADELPEQDDAPKSKKQAAKETLSPTYQNYEARAGYGNYFFQGFQFDRIIKANKTRASWAAGAKEKPLNASGILIGETTAIGVEISEDAIKTSLADQKQTVAIGNGWSRLLESRSLHAFGIGIKLWRDWQQLRPEQLGAATYVGGGAVIQETKQFDLTQITTADIEAYLYSDPESGQLRLLELAIDKNTERFEMYFDNYEIRGDKNFPSQVRFGYAIESLVPALFETVEIKSTVGEKSGEAEQL